MQAGIPSPSYAEPQTASPGQPPAHGGPRRPGRGDPRRTAAGLRPTAARARRPGRPTSPMASVRSRQGDPHQLPRRRPAAPAPRGGGRSSTASPPARPPAASRTQSHLAKEKVAALTVRPSTGGTRKPEPATAGKFARREGQGDDRHRGVLQSRQFQRRQRGGVAEQASRGPGRGGEDDGVGLHHLWLLRRADHQVPPAPRRRARSRTVAPVRTRAPLAATTAAGSRPTPPRMPAKTGAESSGLASRLPPPASGSGPLEQRDQLGYGGPSGDLAGVPGVDASEEWLDEPVDDLLAEAFLHEVADADVPSPRSVAGRTESRAARARPFADSTPSTEWRSSGTPMSVRGIGTSPPRFHRLAEVVAGWTMSSARPTSRARPTASGRRLSIASAPTSTTTPPTSSTRRLPPIRGEASSTVTRAVGSSGSTGTPPPAPSTPPPTTTTSAARRSSDTQPACHGRHRQAPARSGYRVPEEGRLRPVSKGPRPTQPSQRLCLPSALLAR